jgi:hypothetical protein
MLSRIEARNAHSEACLSRLRKRRVTRAIALCGALGLPLPIATGRVYNERRGESFLDRAPAQRNVERARLDMRPRRKR